MAKKTKTSSKRGRPRISAAPTGRKSAFSNRGGHKKSSALSGGSSNGRGNEPRKRIFYPITGEPKADLEALIRAYGLDYEFSKKTLEEADSISQAVTETQLKDRRDFRSGKVVTIDGADARDLDDAIEVERTDRGYRLSVHIADVAHYVTAGSYLDRDAFERGTSVYFPETVLPMLPKKLSNGICSLNPNADRLVLSCIMEFDFGGKRVGEEIVEGVIRTRHRLTYEEVEEVIENRGKRIDDRIDKDIIEMLDVAKELMSILFKKRKERGMIEFDLPESKIELDEEGYVANVEYKSRLLSHRLIEEFMLAANETVAEVMSRAKAPIIYRSHMPPPAEKADTFEDFLDVLGLSFGRTLIGAKPGDWARFLDKLKKEDSGGAGSYSGLVEKVALRSMSKASYEPVNTGHFGLAAEYYCHFTSPIRRYPDLVTHRVVKELINGGGAKLIAKYKAFAADASKVSSARERRAEEAERRCDDLKKSEFMRKHLCEEFDGIISGVTDFGVFVELENSCEGLVRLEDLPKDNYRVDAKVYRVTGKHHKYALGDKVRIRVLNVTGDKVGFGMPA